MAAGPSLRVGATPGCEVSALTRSSRLFAAGAAGVFVLGLLRLFLLPDLAASTRLEGAPLRTFLMQPEVLLSAFLMCLTCTYALLARMNVVLARVRLAAHFWCTLVGALGVIAATYLAI